ncbi:MAG: hypothetical protein U0350_28015 [Caldilineaceae bacterium]
MLTEMSHLETAPRTDWDSAEVAWQRIKQHLEAEKQRIFQEIRQYPPPIPACDVQFNGLLAERAAILQELGKVEAILKQHLTGQDTHILLGEFIRASHYTDDELKENTRQSLSIAHTV